MQDEEGCGGEQQDFEHHALEEGAQLVRVEKHGAARDVVERDKLDCAVVGAVIAVSRGADRVAGLDGRFDLLGNILDKLEGLDVEVLGQERNDIGLRGQKQLIGVGRELDLGVGHFLALAGKCFRGEVLKTPLAQLFRVGEAGGDGRILLRAVRAADGKYF